MKQAIRFGEIAVILICLVGCIQVTTVIKVRPDGSGTIEETLLISKAAMQQMHLSARAYHRVPKLAHTIADLAGSEDIQTTHIAEAIQYRPRRQV